MPIQNFEIGKSMIAASNMARTATALKEYDRKVKSQDAIQAARGEAATGEPKAIQALMKLDPAGAGQIISNLSNMDKQAREKVKSQAESTAKQMTWVMQGENEQAQSERFDQVVDFMKQSGREDAEQYRGQFSPALAENWIMKAMTVDDLSEQFAFGQLKVAEKDGKPVYIQTNDAGQTREAPVPEGIGPVTKDDKGSGKGSGGAGDDFKLSASDENSMKSAVAALHGGTYDPTTGRISGITKGQEANVMAISARATRIYKDANGSKTRTESAAEAARELGVPVPKAKPQSIDDYLKSQNQVTDSIMSVLPKR